MTETNDNGMAEGEMQKNVSEWWRTLCGFLFGVVITLVGAWAANGASKTDIREAISTNNQLLTLRLETLGENQRQATVQIGEMQRTLRKMAISLGNDFDGPDVLVDGKPYKGKSR